jgi:tripartite-type tricarboxylate transporter receptor subunit TctC
MPILRTATLCLFAILAGSAQAQQQWPDRQIKIVVGFPPGPLDIVGRPVAQKLQEALGQPVIFENRPGANGTIATELVMRSEPDGYTILLGTAGTHVTAVHLFKNLRYDPVKDFMPIVAAVEPATCLVVSSALPIKSVAELIAYSKANPGKLSYGSTGVGSVFHLLGELFNQTTGSAIVHVPYKGADGAINDVIAGHLPLAFTAISTAGPHIQAGTVRILAITEPQRFSRMPDVPSITETIPAFKKPSTWMGTAENARTHHQASQCRDRQDSNGPGDARTHGRKRLCGDRRQPGRPSQPDGRRHRPVRQDRQRRRDQARVDLKE